MNNNVNGRIIDIDYDQIKYESIRDLETLCCDELTEKVKKLSAIVDSIEGNWHGSNAEKYRSEIDEIMNAITEFKTKVLEPNIRDITAQVDAYKNNEEVG